MIFKILSNIVLPKNQPSGTSVSTPFPDSEAPVDQTTGRGCVHLAAKQVLEP